MKPITRTRSFIASLFTAAAVLSAAFVVPASAQKVSRVVDGDTIVLEDGTTIRYIGIDSPETVHPSKPVEFMAKEACEYNRSLVEGKNVRLEYDVERIDRRGRTLAYVYVEDLFVNAELVRAGYAQTLTIPPDVRYSELFAGYQQQAREANRGLWNESAANAWTSPAPVTSSGKYYITKTGSKYHRGGCRYLSKSAFEIAKDEAVGRGFGACSVCVGSPATPDPPSTYTTPKVSSGASGRCQATTKKGTQCKRSAKAGSTYCWQHGG